jgi:hypothetical protein
MTSEIGCVYLVDQLESTNSLTVGAGHTRLQLPKSDLYMAAERTETGNLSTNTRALNDSSSHRQCRLKVCTSLSHPGLKTSPSMIPCM